MRDVVCVLLYALMGWLVYLGLKVRSGRDPESTGGDDGLNIFFALIWPITIFGLMYYLFYRATWIDPTYSSPRMPQEPMAPWKRKPPTGDYNKNNLGSPPGDDPEDMAAFMKGLESRPDAPLPDALTFSYSLTGISKTYPKGTMFPSALVADWKRGFYMGDEKAET